VDEVDPLSAVILVLLVDAPAVGGVSLPRISKKLGLSASVLLRHLALMGDAEIGGRSGPGWVRVVQTEDRWIVHLTDAGRAAAAAAGPAF
jgi:FdhD protein